MTAELIWSQRKPLPDDLRLQVATGHPQALACVLSQACPKVRGKPSRLTCFSLEASVNLQLIIWETARNL